MSDIDFDELDRAVTSVLNGGEVKRDKPESAIESVAEPYQPEPKPAPEKPVAVSAQALHPLAQRPVQRGRFLDMVHPAHDMGPRTNTTVKPLGRPGAAMSQSTNQTFVSDVVSKGAAQTPADEPDLPAETVKSPATNSEFPLIESAPEPVAEPTDFFAGGPTDAKPVEPTPSPFIADAKVEKRPLGAFASAESATLPVGDELHEKLVEVESEDNVIETAESPIPVKIVDPIPVITPIKKLLEAEKTDTKDAVLFDREHSAKNRIDKAPKHGKSAVIWITVLLSVILIGGGVGATLYFFVLK